MDADGRWFVDDVETGDLWYFPSGIPHAIQSTGEDGCEFLLAFDDGGFDEEILGIERVERERPSNLIWPICLRQPLPAEQPGLHAIVETRHRPEDFIHLIAIL